MAAKGKAKLIDIYVWDINTKENILQETKYGFNTKVMHGMGQQMLYITEVILYLLIIMGNYVR